MTDEDRAAMLLAGIGGKPGDDFDFSQFEHIHTGKNFQWDKQPKVNQSLFGNFHHVKILC